MTKLRVLLLVVLSLFLLGGSWQTKTMLSADGIAPALATSQIGQWLRLSKGEDFLYCVHNVTDFVGAVAPTVTFSIQSCNSIQSGACPNQDITTGAATGVDDLIVATAALTTGTSRTSFMIFADDAALQTTPDFPPVTTGDIVQGFLPSKIRYVAAFGGTGTFINLDFTVDCFFRS